MVSLLKNLGILMNVYKITLILLLLFILMNFSLGDKKIHNSSHNGEEVLRNSPKIKLETSMKMIHSKAISLRQERLQIEKAKQRLKHEAMTKVKVLTISNQEKQKQNTKKWMKFNASYYGPDCKGCSGITVTGINVRETNSYNGLRIVAVDPKVLPLGTIVEITTPYESFRAISADKGGAIKGYKLDILVESEEVASEYGRHNVQLRIIQYP